VVLARLRWGATHTPEAAPWASLTAADVAHLRDALVRRYPTGGTARRLWHVLRGVVRECDRLGTLAEPAAKLLAVKPPPGQPRRVGRELAPADQGAMVAAAGGLDTPAGLAVALLCALGLRVSEAAALRVADWIPADRTLVVRTVKGGRLRLLAAPPALARACDRATAGRPTTEALLGGATPPHPRTLWRWWRAAAAARGVATTGTHDGRRTVLSGCLERTGDLNLAATIAGHRSPASTAAYDLRAARAARRLLAEQPEPWTEA
jgi:integrase